MFAYRISGTSEYLVVMSMFITGLTECTQHSCCLGLFILPRNHFYASYTCVKLHPVCAIELLIHKGQSRLPSKTLEEPNFIYVPQ